MMVPNFSTDVKEKSSFAAFSSTFVPRSDEINSPSPFNSFKAFHSFELWLAVKIIPPSALSIFTASSTVGVVDNPRSITSIPKATRTLTTRLWIISPLIRPSRPTTILDEIVLSE